MTAKAAYIQPSPIGKRSWFIALRFLIPLLLIGSGLVFLKPIAFNYTLLAIYGGLSFVFFVYTFSAQSYSEGFVRGLIITLISCELLIEGLLVNHVGGNFSPFILFFIITIVTASLFFHLIGSLFVATLAGLLYSLPIFLNLSFIYEGLIDPTRLAGLGISSDEAFYTVFLHLCLFYSCGFISGYLAESLFMASRELSKIRLETGEILEQMQSGLITFDADGRIIYFNRAAMEILGVNQAHARGRLLSDVFESGLGEFTRGIDRALLTGRSEMRAEITIRHPEKGPMPVGISTSVLRDEEHRAMGVIAVFQDLTEAKRLEAHMRASDRLAAVGQLASGIAHEIRNPLASISGSVEVLKDDLKPQGDDLRLLELILKESSRLNTILTDFLNFSRVTKAPTGKCDLASVISEVTELASTRQEFANSVTLSSDVHRSSVWVVGSENQLKQILWNLLLNSAQAMGHKRGKILIRTEEYQSDDVPMVRMVVADNGPGIPESIRDRIFDPFFSTKQEGTGLGLPIVARIVDCLGGRVEFESTGDWGAIFSVFLPVSSSIIKESQVPQEVRRA